MRHGDMFNPDPRELAMLAAMIFPTVREPKKAVALAEEIARTAHARAIAIRNELEAADRKLSK